MKQNGRYANGRQRWYCNPCKKSYSWRNYQVRENNQSIWFVKWITEGYSVRQLSEISGHHPTKLRRLIEQGLRQNPPVFTESLSKFQYLIFDGTFLHRPVSIVTMMDAKTNRIIAGQYGISEFSMSQLYMFFEPLKQKGLIPISYTIDGNPHVFKVLKELWPNIIIQRCLVHIQRQGMSWCRRFPRRTDAKHLRNIFKQVCYIDNDKQKQQFIELFENWQQRFGFQIHAQPEKGKVFSDIRRARSMLINAIPDMFHYLEDFNIPKTTNALEGYYSRLKQHYRLHRGLRKEKLHTYFNWYFNLRPK